MLGPWISIAVALSHVGKQATGCHASVLWRDPGQGQLQFRGLPTAPSPISPELAMASPPSRPGSSPSSTSSWLVHLETLVLCSPRLISALVVMAGDGHEVLSPCSTPALAGVRTLSPGVTACVIMQPHHSLPAQGQSTELRWWRAEHRACHEAGCGHTHAL